MTPFTIAPSAQADLDTLREYLAEELGNLALAERTLGEFYVAIRKISRNPEIGHFRTDLAPKPTRFWRVHSYLIVYRLTNVVQISRIIHAARDFPDLPLEE